MFKIMKQIDFCKSELIQRWLVLTVVTFVMTACAATPVEKTKQPPDVQEPDASQAVPMEIAVSHASVDSPDTAVQREDEVAMAAPRPENISSKSSSRSSSRSSSNEPEEASLATETPPAPSMPFGLKLVRDVWQQLDKAKNSCGGYNYYPEGGMQSFACNVMSLAPFTALYEQAQIDLFLSGPHSNSALNLASKKDFGHYNPEFVRWAVENLVPGTRDSAFRAATQPMYDSYVAPLARLFYHTHRKIEREPVCFDKEVKRYQRALKKKKGPRDFVERYFFFMNSDFCRRPDDEEYFFKHGFDGGFDGNVTKTCVGFWIRRHLDGTREQFYAGLRQLLLAYEPTLLENDADDSDVFVPGIQKPPKKKRPAILKPITPTDFHEKPAHLR